MKYFLIFFSYYLTDWFRIFETANSNFFWVKSHKLLPIFTYSPVYVISGRTGNLHPTSHALELRKLPILPQGRKWGLLTVILGSLGKVVEDEKRKATRVFLLCQFFLTIKVKEKEVLLLCYQNTANLMDRAPSAKWEI